MNKFRIIGSFLFALVLVASVVAPAEVAALVPPSAHDFFFGPQGMTLASAVTLTGFSRRARGVDNLGGIKSIILFADEDFTVEWPQKKDIVAGVLSVAPTLAVGVTGAVLKFDNNTARAKSSRKGDLGYQNVDVDGEAKFAGYEASQIAAIEKTLNNGGIAICVYKDGTRAVYGSSAEPLVFEDTTDSGAKADDKLQIDFKFKGSGYAFHPPLLASSVVIPLPA